MYYTEYSLIKLFLFGGGKANKPELVRELASVFI